MLKLGKETPGIQGGDHDDLEVLNKEFEKSEPENRVIAVSGNVTDLKYVSHVAIVRFDGR